MPTQLAGEIKAAREAGPTGPFASLRNRFIVVGVVLAATAMLMTLGLLTDAFQRQRASTIQQLGATARALSLAVDGEILQRRVVLGALAASPALQSGDLKAFEAEARASPVGQDSWILLLSPDGHVVIDTDPRASHPTVLGGARRAASWADLLRRGERISGLETRQRRLIVHLDRLITVNGRPTYELGVVMLPSAIQTLLTQNLPASWYASIADVNGMLLARNKDPQRWVGTSVSRALQHALTKAPAGVYESAAKDGVLTLAAYNRSPATHWTVIVAVPRRDAGDMIHSLQWLSAAGAALLLMGGALTLWFVRGVARAVRRLEAYANSLDGGPVSPPERTGLREIDFIAAALAATANRVHARETEMQRINETLEERVREASARLVQSQKVEAIGRLTGGVAHDFNNLLTAVIGNLDLLRRKLEEERLRGFADNALSAAQRGAKLTAQLLAFARKQALTREPVDVNALIVGMGELMASTLDHDCLLETDLDPDTPVAMADRTQLEMVLLNLVINARDALPEKGTIRIVTTRERVMTPPDRPELPPPGDFVCITVADDGVGMDQEVMERAFEPFFTTKPPGRGSGLGLSQALGVAQQLGGGLSIDSFPGRGAQVHVYLPLVPAVAPETSEPLKPRRRVFSRQS